MRTPHLVVALLLTAFAIPAAAAVTGTVMTPEGQPLAGARVLLQAIESPDQRIARLLSDAPDIVPLAETQTDAKGAFSLPSPKEAVVDLRIEVQGAEPLSRRIERDEDLGAVIVVKREMQKGTVTAGGKPVANALVVVSYQGEYTTRTDEQGRYEAPDVKRASRITVIHPDFAIDEETYSFPGGASAGELKRTLHAGTSLSGRAVAANGTSPVAGAEILVDGWPLGTSGEDGTFTISRAPAKWTTIIARKGMQIGYRAAGADKTITVRMEKGAVVSGRVVDAKTKVPVAGVTVRMAVPRMPAAGEQPLIAQTDAKGVYSIPGPPGTYMLVVTHPAYGTESQNVTVAAGQQISKDLNLNQLARVSGVVVDEERRPVVAAAVNGEAVTRETSFRMMRFSRNTPVVSGPDGRFSLRVLPDSDLQLRATKKGLPQVTGDTFKLAPGERKAAVVLTIPSGVAVTGRALDQNGVPLSGVTVSATETPQGDRGAMMRTMIFAGGMPGEEEDLVRTTSDGSFELRVKEGTYDFTFQREGYARKSVRAQSITANGENTVEIRLDPAVEISGRVSRAGVGVPDVQIRALTSMETVATTGPDGAFSLGGLSPGVTRVMLRKEAELINEQRSFTAPARDLVIDLPEGGTIRGRVVEKGTKKPIASFQAGVATSRSGGGMISMAPPQLKSFTSEDGSFTLEHVPPGATNLVAAAPGYAGSRMNVDVENGKSLDDIVLELDKGVRLTGKVTGSDGSPLSDATVLVTPSPNGTFAMSGSVPRATTDANGEYTLDALLPGEETVQASHPKHVEVSRKVTLKGQETKLDLQLTAGARITGVVVTEDGMPVAEAYVSASSGGRPREARTNASGSFEIDSISPGRYRFTASKSGFADGVVEDVDISSGAPVRIALKTGGTIYGRVTGLQEADYARTSVHASSGRSYTSAAVDPQGNFKMEGAPVGTARVWASSSAGMSGSRSTSQQTVEVAAGSSQQVNLEFGGDTVIQGRVTRNGDPVSGAAVGFIPKQGSSSNSGTGSGVTDENGRYSISGLEPGEYNVSVRDMQRFSSYSTTYTVRGAATFDIAYTAGFVRGRVLNAATNEPINGATVQLRPTSPSTESWMNNLGATADSTGTFSIELVPAGSYAVTAAADGFANQIVETSIGNAGRDDLEIKLMRNDGVKLKIVDGRDGRQLNGNAVAFDAQGRVIHDGRMVRFFGGSSPEDLTLQLPPGSYSVTVASSNYAPRTISVMSPSTPTVSLTPGGTIRLQSKHSERRRFRLLDASGWQYPRWDARPTPGVLQPGTTPLSNVAAGNYTIQLLNDNESVADQIQVTVREGEIVDVSI